MSPSESTIIETCEKEESARNSIISEKASLSTPLDCSSQKSLLSPRRSTGQPRLAQLVIYNTLKNKQTIHISDGIRYSNYPHCSSEFKWK